MNIKIIFLSTFLISILSGCIEYKEDKEFSNNLKNVQNYEVLKIDRNKVYYFDENKRIQEISIRSDTFFIIESNETYLRKQIYGGLVDFEQWTLFIKK